jgi:hypothetical protein
MNRYLITPAVDDVLNENQVETEMVLIQYHVNF